MQIKTPACLNAGVFKKSQKLIGQPQRRLTSVYDLVKTRWVSEARA